MLHQKRIKFDFWLTNEHKLRKESILDTMYISSVFIQ